MKKPAAPRKKTPARRAAPAKPKTKVKAKVKAKSAAPAHPALLAQLVAALDAKKAEQLQIFHVGEQSSITDYLVLGTATSDPHLRALRIEAERIFDDAKAKLLGTESVQGSGWTVIDAFDIMVHLFTAENRGKYRLEMLWRDATEVPVASLTTS